MVVYEPFPTVPLSEFHSELRFEWPDLPVELFDYYLLRTATDMCRRAPLIHRRVRITLQPEVTRYAVKSPDGMTMVAITGLRHIPTGNEECGSHQVPRSFSAPEHLCCAAGDKAWYDPDEEVLTLHLNQGGVVAVDMSVVPAPTACVLPAAFRDELFPTLIMGTRAGIMLITGRPWTNLKVGGELYNEYNRMLGRAAVDRSLRKQRGIVKMNFGRAL